MTRIILTLTVLAAAFFTGGISCHAADADKVSFGCTTHESGMTVYVNNYDPDSEYSLSINGGNFFMTMNGSGMHFPSLPTDTYQLCVMKNNDKSTLSNILSVPLGSSGILPENEILLRCEGVSEDTYKNGSLLITIENYSPETEYMLSYNGGKRWHTVKSRTITVSGLYSGYYSICVKSPDNAQLRSRTANVYVPPKIPDGGTYIAAPLVMQLPELPTGCEITSLAMAINFYDIGIKNTILADFFLEKSEYRAGDFRKKFVGDPREINAYGCYAGVIEKSAKKFLITIPRRSFDVVNMTGCSPDRLYSYLDMGYPVIVWATSKMLPTKQGPSWMDRETGNIVTWTGNEHCMLLTGYDKKLNRVYMNDPQYGTVSYDMRLFENRFREMESQAIAIVETTKK